MKGKKLVIAVILALIVCLVLIPTCAFADEAVPDAQTDGQQQTEQTYEQSNAAAPDTPDAAVTGKDDSSDNDEGKNLPDSGDKEAADPASGDNSSNDQSVDGDETKGEETIVEETKGNETEESKVVEEDTSGAENVPLQPEEPKYTVEFGENKEFVLNGGESAKLSDVLGALGITGEISSAASSDDSLFSVKQDEKGEWSVTAENCFSSEQRMTVVVNGQTYEIVVTDEGVVAKNITANKEYTSLQNAINEAGENAVIQLSDNVTESVTIASGKTITIDLNGKTLTNKEDNDTISNYGKLTITGSGTVDNTVVNSAQNASLRCSALVNYPDGEVILNGGHYTKSKDGDENSWWSVIKNMGTMTINGGVTVDRAEVKHELYKVNTGTVLIENGLYTLAPWGDVRDRDVKVGNLTKDATLIINGGTFTAYEANAIYNNVKGSLVINGGTITAKNTSYPDSIDSVNNYGTVEITAGTINGNVYSGAREYNGTRSTGNITISDGTFNGNIKNYGSAIATINNGTFNGKVHCTNSKNNGGILVNDGTFNGNVSNTNGGSFDAVGGIYTDENVKKLTGKDYIVVTAGGKYAVNESGYALAKDAHENGEATTIVKAPDGAKIDDVPVGVKIVNNSGNTIYINGVEVKHGEEHIAQPMPEPTPDPKPTPDPDPKPAEDNKTETSDSTTVIATAYAPLYAKYLVLEGKGQQWTAGDIEFVLNSNTVVKVLIDGVEVEFTVAEDGTVTIAAAVIEALEAGTHEIQFIFADGSCMTTFTK